MPKELVLLIVILLTACQDDIDAGVVVGETTVVKDGILAMNVITVCTNQNGWNTTDGKS